MQHALGYLRALLPGPARTVPVIVAALTVCSPSFISVSVVVCNDSELFVEYVRGEDVAVGPADLSESDALIVFDGHDFQDAASCFVVGSDSGHPKLSRSGPNRLCMSTKSVSDQVFNSCNSVKNRKKRSRSSISCTVTLPWPLSTSAFPVIDGSSPKCGP